MLSTLIISPNKTKREDYALDLCKELRINPFDITIIESEQPLGIEDIRNMQRKLFLKPLKSKQKAMVIKNAHFTTIVGQNALLKILEEPPANTIIVLAAETEKTFLPTILSRCKVIKLEESPRELSEEEKKSYTGIFVFLQQATISEKLKIAEDLAKNKETASKWLENMIKIARGKLLEQDISFEETNNYIIVLKLLQKAHTSINYTNKNLRFLLEYTYLNL